MTANVPDLIPGSEPKKHEEGYICRLRIFPAAHWGFPYRVYEDCHENAAEKYANHEALAYPTAEFLVEREEGGEAKLVKLKRQFSTVESRPYVGATP